MLTIVFGLAFSLSGSAGLKQKNSLSELSAEEIADLQFMREEEKLARDIYLNMLDEWGLLIFENIAQSEQNHMDAIKRQLVKNDVEDPVDDESVRDDFRNEFLDEFYVNLMELGIQSEMSALTVGGTDPGYVPCLREGGNHAVFNIYREAASGFATHVMKRAEQKSGDQAGL